VTILNSDDQSQSWLSNPIIVMAFPLVAMLCGLAGWFIVRQKADLFQPIEKFPAITSAEVTEVISKGVKLDEKVTLQYIRDKLAVTQFQSQGKTYTVFRIISPETCGKLGCLHVVKPSQGVAIPLQLQDIEVGIDMFKASLKPQCFIAVQPQDRQLKDFEICEKTP
jgi:hypothetical protein